MIKHLALLHEVTVCSLARTEAEAADAQGIAAYCARFFVHRVNEPLQVIRMVARLPTATPSSLGYFYSTSMAQQVRRLLATERFDMIFVHCSSVAQFVAGHSGTPKILDFGDMDSQKWFEYARCKPLAVRAGYQLEGMKMLAEEKRLARRFDLCTTTTRGEWETLESYGTGTPTDWFPNGVDSEYFAPDGDRYDADTISFVGRMDYYPNQECMLDFCANVLPRLRRRRPNIRLTIIGAEPSLAIRRLGEVPGVTVTGSVPDVRPYVQRSALMVAPLNIARGTQNKILEAMAQGVPVVASGVAARGVDANPVEHLLVANTPDECEAAIISILDDGNERARLAAAGRARTRSHHDWALSMRRLDAIIERCLAKRAPVEAGGGLAPQPH
jgi:sugar transferase (PEP-CTERM/EpsH1 system associated)